MLPKPPAPLVIFSGHLARILRTWQASALIRTLNTEQRAEMRLKISAMAIFGEKATNWGFRHTWQADYLALSAHNNSAEAYRMAAKHIVATNLLGDRVVFSTQGFKYSVRGNASERALVLTNTYLLKLNPAKDYVLNPKSHSIPVGSITGVALPNSSEPLVILQLADGGEEVWG
jgi:hypothetical protein